MLLGRYLCRGGMHLRGWRGINHGWAVSVCWLGWAGAPDPSGSGAGIRVTRPVNLLVGAFWSACALASTARSRSKHKRMLTVLCRARGESELASGRTPRSGTDTTVGGIKTERWRREVAFHPQGREVGSHTGPGAPIHYGNRGGLGLSPMSAVPGGPTRTSADFSVPRLAGSFQIT